jgi:hypothetical protein
MKNWQFWVLVVIILIQSIYISARLNNIEEQQEHILSTATYNGIDISHVKGDTETIIGILPDILN